MTNPIDLQSVRRRLATTAGIGAFLVALVLAAPEASAQAAAVSTFALPISATVSAAASGLPEAVTFSGTAHVTATVATDPTLPPQVVVAIDGRGVTGVGQTSGFVYKNECEANLTRPLAALDTIHLTFAVFKEGPGSALSARSAFLTLNLTYNTTTMVLTNVTGTVSALPALASATP
ncbi:MAG TPA: hypothetical protein VGH20_02445 [Myxococcales bacterium]|jgi:hypothetical protein